MMAAAMNRLKYFNCPLQTQATQQASRSVNFIEPRLISLKYLRTISNALFQYNTRYKLYLPGCSKTKAEDEIVFVTSASQYLLHVSSLKSGIGQGNVNKRIFLLGRLIDH